MFTTEIRCEISDGTGQPNSKNIITRLEVFRSLGGNFDFDVDKLDEASSQCICIFLDGADTSVQCSTTIKRCPLSQNFINVSLVT